MLYKKDLTPIIGQEDKTMTFKTELRDLINRHSLENNSNTPDFMLAAYLNRCLDNFNITLRDRDLWHTDPLGERETETSALKN